MTFTFAFTLRSSKILGNMLLRFIRFPFSSSFLSALQASIMIQWIENFTTRRLCNLIVFYQNKILYRVSGKLSRWLRSVERPYNASKTSAKASSFIFIDFPVFLWSISCFIPLLIPLFTAAIFANCFSADAFVVI
jgi:hypothetical protein